MRKTIVLLVSLLLLCSFSTLSFAQKSHVKTAKKTESNMETIKGSVISIDTTKNEIVVRDEKTSTDKTISVNSKIAASLKVGEVVKAKVNSVTNIAESVKKIVEKKTTTKKANIIQLNMLKT